MGIRSSIKNLQLPRHKLVVLTFHQASDYFNPKINGKYIWSEIKHLENQIIFLKKNYKIYRLSAAIEKIEEGKVNETIVAITFDDGDWSIKDFIVPLFEKHEIPATFFINTAYSSGLLKGYWYNIFQYMAHGTRQQKAWAESLQNEYDVLRSCKNPVLYNVNRVQIEKLSAQVEPEVNFYIDLPYLEQLNNQLFEVGLHGHEHQRFSMMDEQWQKSNLEKNLETLAGLEQFKPIFALPFGKTIDYNPTTVKIANELNLKLVLSENGINRNFDQIIKRIPADGRDVSAIFKYLYHFASNLKMN